MKKIIGLLLIALSITSCGDSTHKEDEKSTTYYLIRHAEKDRSDSEERNPHLTEIGKQRAMNWARYFDSIPLNAVYSTDYNRTLETALPTAVKKELEVQLYNPRTVYDSVFKMNTLHKKVLVVGHSNTTPAFANAILASKKYEDIDDAENGMLFTIQLRETDTITTLQKIEY